jgi:Undecaprenyl-phosphate glucose phosphotransferase
VLAKLIVLRLGCFFMFNRSTPITHGATDVAAPQRTNGTQPNDISALAKGFASVGKSGVSLTSALQLLALTDFAAVVAAAMLSKFGYLNWFLGTDAGLFPYLPIAVGLGVTLYVVYKQLGLYDIERINAPGENAQNIIRGLVISYLTILGVLYAFKQAEEISRGWVFVWLVGTALLVCFARTYIVRRVRRSIAAGRLQRRTAIIGTKDYAVTLSAQIAQAEGWSGAIDFYALGSEDVGDNVVGRMVDLQRTMVRRPYDRVIVGIPASDIDNIRSVVKTLGSYTTELLLCSDLATPVIKTSGVRQFGSIRTDVVHLLPGSENLWWVKRALDVVIAAVFLVSLLPLFVLVALAIKLDSKGPVFFLQQRLGQNNSVFRIFKFRSMTVTEDGSDVVQATRDDKRVTRVGRILRAASIDELPQLINVLLGHMSLVGPRPHALVHDQAFEQQFDLFTRRRRVKPGITGWAQVNGFRGETRQPEDVRRRMEHDLFYIDHWSIWFDLEIIARTVFVVAKGAY